MKIKRKNYRAKTVINKGDKNLSFFSDLHYCEYLEQNPDFRDYMEDYILSINNFNSESFKHLFCVFDGHGGD